jgi:hypothetical protein
MSTQKCIHHRFTFKPFFATLGPEKSKGNFEMDIHPSSLAVSQASVFQDDERRRYPRLVFSPTDGVTAGTCFTTSANPPLSIRAMVMNLSRGGLGMGIPRKEMCGLSLIDGDLFTVSELHIAHRQGRVALEAEAQIRWHIDADELDQICFGCAFNAPSGALEQKLIHFVESNFPHLTLG